MTKSLRTALLALCVLLSSFTVASACPTCGEANGQHESRPRAYMLSILFMMSMPALVLTGFGVGFYRLHRRSQAVEALRESESESRP